MKGGSSYNFAVKKLALILIALICLTLAILAWEKTPFLTTFLPPSGQLGMMASMVSPVIPVTTHPANQSVYPHEKQPIMEIPSESSLEKVLSESSGEEVPLQPAMENNFSVTVNSEIGFDFQQIEGTINHPSEDSKDGSNLKMVTLDKKECIYAKGKWVADSRRPLYSGLGCKQWLSEMWSCRLNQRTDFSYESYRWQPNDCEMPEFEGSKFLKRMQHRTIAFVGDSLGRQQFQSLMCMLAGGIENHKVKDIGKQYGLVKARGAIRPDGWAYRFPDTNTTILYYWSASLCELEPINKSDPSSSFAMHLDRPATFIKRYLHRFDVLVLNTGHHWNRGKINGNRWVMYVNGMANADRKIAIAYSARNLTVHSVAKWIDSQLPKHPRLKVFFRTTSPRHFVDGDWNSGGSCDNTVPLRRGSEVTKDESDDAVTAEAVKGTKIKLLDITALSQLRDEGHVSNYSIRAKPGSYDCLHWCLPGIPDTWNELLAAQV